MKNKEEFNESDFFAEIMELERLFDEQTRETNENLFKVIKKLKGKRFVNDLKFLNKYNDSNLPYYISKKPLGKIQSEYETRVIKEAYVEQWTTGMEGDSFAGNISVKIRENQFIIMPFNC